MNYLENYCLHISRLQGMSGLRESGGNNDTMFIERNFPSSRTYVATQRVFQMPSDGVL